MAEEEDNKAIWPGAFPEAKTVEDFDYLMTGKNGGPITKIPKSRLAEVIGVIGESIPAIQGGATAATAVELPAGPVGHNRFFDASWGFWKYNNVVLKNPTGTDGIPEGSDGQLYWSGATTEIWSIPKMQALPKGKDGKTTEPFNAAKAGGYPAGDQVYFGENKIYKALVAVPMGQSPTSNPEKWEEELEGTNQKTKTLDEKLTQVSKNIRLDDWRSRSLDAAGVWSNADSPSWLGNESTLPKNNTEYRIKGVGAVGTTVPRYAIVDSSGAVVLVVTNTQNGLLTNFVITTPLTGAPFKIRLTVAAGTNVGADLPNTPYRNTVMISEGNADLPFETPGYTLVKPLADLIAGSTPSPTKLDKIYISPTGSDSNNGSSDLAPVLTFAKAISIASDNCELIMLTGDYPDVNFDLSAFSKITANLGATVRWVNGTRFNTATKETGYTKVYSVSYTYAGTWVNTYRLWQHDIPDSRSLIDMSKRLPVHDGRTHRLPSTMLKSVSSIAEIESSIYPVYYYDKPNNKMYFSIVDGSSLATNPLAIPSQTGFVFSKVKKVDWFNFTILYKGVTFLRSMPTLKNITIGGGLGGGQFNTGNTFFVDLQYCRAWGGNNDGFNGAGVGFANNRSNTVVHLTNCWAHDNFDDGESHHQWCRVVAKECLAEYNGSGFTPASGCHAEYYNCTAQKNEGTGFSAQGPPLDGGIGTNILCVGCVAEDNTTSNFNGVANDSRFVLCSSIRTIGTGIHFNTLGRIINSFENGVLKNR